MADYTITPNMSLTPPIVGQTLGPTWATLVNYCMTLIDAHDHAHDRGVRITQDAFVPTNDVDVYSQRIKRIMGAVFVDGGYASAGANTAYVQDGDFWYRDADGTNIQLTKDGTINFSLAAGFTGDYGAGGVSATASYTNATRLFEFFSSTGPSVYAHLKFMDLQLQGAIKLASTNVQALAGNLVISDSDDIAILLVDTSAPRNVTLPASSAARRVLEIKDATGAAMTNNISLIPNGTNTIEGLASTKLLATNWGSWKVVSNGAGAWYML